jgi:hypothetical protein
MKTLLLSWMFSKEHVLPFSSLIFLCHQEMELLVNEQMKVKDTNKTSQPHLKASTSINRTNQYISKQLHTCPNEVHTGKGASRAYIKHVL